jgi:Na+:H+ antiporter, NhaA family
MKKYLPFLIVLAVGLLTLGGGTLLYRAKLLAAATAAKNFKAAEADKAKALHVRGEATAPVTLEEFGDFQCPPCGTLAGGLKQLEKDYGDRLRVIFYEFPLVVHEHAREAAFAAEAAGLQNHFWEMHDLLYQEQANWSKGTDVRAMFKAYAGTLGLEVDRFLRDMESAEVKARVASEQKLGTSRGVESTPTVFINNERVPVPSLNPDGLRTIIDKALKEKPAP